MCRGFDGGWPIHWDEGCEIFRYDDTGLPAEGTRPCRKCGAKREGPDECLGNLPGVKYACCGHGVSSQAYIMFENGIVVRGFTEVYDNNKALMLLENDCEEKIEKENRS